MKLTSEVIEHILDNLETIEFNEKRDQITGVLVKGLERARFKITIHQTLDWQLKINILINELPYWCNHDLTSFDKSLLYVLYEVSQARKRAEREDEMEQVRKFMKK